MPVRHHNLYRSRRFELLERRELLAASGDAAGPLQVVFDYSLDTSNFFADSQRRVVLQAAADSLVSRFTDDLSAIQPSGSNGWSPAIFHPRTQAQHVLPSSLAIPANQILIYVGARDLPNNQLGEGASGYFTTAQGSQAWLDTVRGRGEAGALAAAPTDIGPWGGSLAFDEPHDWYFGLEADGLGSQQNDFFSVAVHELAHLLGFGIVFPGPATSSWENLVVNNQFTGPKARAEYGGNVPLASGAHWQNGIQSDGREAAMDPTLTVGQRKLFTSLDLAAMDDIGWSVTVPSQLTLQLDHSVIDEDAGGQAATLTITRSGPARSTAQTIGLASSDLSEASLTTSVVIPAGQTKASVPVAAVDDRLLDGPQTVSLSASGAGLDPAAIDLIVRDVESITAAFNVESVIENAAAGALELTVRRSNTDVDKAVAVTVTGGDRAQLVVPGSIVIPAGQAAITVPVLPVDDTAPEVTRTFTFTVAAAGYQSSTVAVDVLDDEPPFFQNLEDAYDVDRNGLVEPYDLLVIINRLNRAGSVALDPKDGVQDSEYVDVSGDYMLTPLDANLLNNELNRLSRPR